MKKKNVIGHMLASKDASQGWFRRLNILPRLLCLLLAVLIWLLVVNMQPSDRRENQEINLPVMECIEE